MYKTLWLFGLFLQTGSRLTFIHFISVKMQPTSLLFVLLLAVFADAVKVFRAGNAKVPVTGTEAKAKDFGALVDGEFQPGHGGGLSTNIDPALLPGKPTKNVYSIDSSQVIAGGFGFLADGSDVGGKAGKGHRSIVIKKPFTPTALLHALNALPWKKEPDAPKPTKTPAPRAMTWDVEAEPTEPAASTAVAPTPIAPMAVAEKPATPKRMPLPDPAQHTESVLVGGALAKITAIIKTMKPKATATPNKPPLSALRGGAPPPPKPTESAGHAILITGKLAPKVSATPIKPLTRIVRSRRSTMSAA